jgi:hypothetical protein
VKRLGADDRGRELCVTARERGAGILERDARAFEARALLLDLCRGLRDLRAGVRVVEPRDDLAGLDPLAFLDQHVYDFARDLGRHGGLPAGNDIARRVENRSNGRRRGGRTLGGKDFLCRSDARFQWVGGSTG